MSDAVAASPSDGIADYMRPCDLCRDEIEQDASTGPFTYMEVNASCPVPSGLQVLDAGCADA